MVVSGRQESVESSLLGLRDEGVKITELKVSHAFHSALMDPMLEAFEEAASKVSYASPRLTLVSNVSGRVAGDEICHARYWREHVRSAVNFAGGMRTLEEAGVSTYLELGPAPVLLGFGTGLCRGGVAALGRWITPG